MRTLPTLLATAAAIAAGVWLGLKLADREQAPPLAEELPREPSPDLASTRRAVPAPEATLIPHPEPAAEAPGGIEARWSDLNRMAIRALDAGDFATAVARFEQCVKGVPDEPVFQRNLAEALARRAVKLREEERPCARCLEDLARAIELVPTREDLAQLHARWRAEAEIEHGFWRETSQHFELSYDGERSQILHGSFQLLEELESAYQDLSELFGSLPVERGRPRIQVVLYRRAGFDALTGLGDWAGGAFDGTLRIPVEDLERELSGLRGILRHELVHAFVLECGGREVPGWLNEGLAQWLEPGREGALARSRQALANQELFSLEELSGSLAAWKDAARIERAYAQSLLFVDHLARDYGERVPFAMVSACRGGKPPATSFQEITRVPLGTALADLAGGL